MVCYRAPINPGWKAFEMFKRYCVIAAMLAGLAAAPAAGQNASEAESLISAVKDRDPGKAVMILRNKPALVNAKNFSGETALTIAVARRDDDWTSFLLAQGADPNAADRKGETPLIIAARLGYTTGAAHLASRKAKIDGTNKQGETPLIVAVQQRHVQMVRLLLGAGADPDKTDDAQGYSARDYAKRDPRARDILRLSETGKPKS